MKTLLFVLFLFTSAISTFAQTIKKVTGKITAESGVALAGVSVNVKGTNNGVITEADGTFTIDVAEGKVLVVSYVDYENIEIKIGQLADYSVALKLNNESLGEVVVIGYGTQKRTTLTGAIATISSKTLNELPVPNIDQALQGRIAGVSVVNNGSPGSTPIVAIRGISSVNGNGSPFYVVDGVPASLNAFDGNDVESVEVLKDASAAAIYGSRATNGVILITTKKGKRSGKLQVNYNSFIGSQSPAKKIDLLNSAQYKQFATTLLGGVDKLPPRLADSNFNKPVYVGAAQTFAQTNTDWQDEYFKRNTLITQHNISVSGGNEVSRFYTSAGYFKQDGIAQGLGYERGNFRINSEHLISKVFTLGQNLYFATSNQQYDGTGGNRSPLGNVIRMQPYLPVYNPNNNGGFMGPISSFDGSDPTNPVEPAKLFDYRNKQLRILGSAFLEITFTPWLKYRSTFGIDYGNSTGSQYTPIYNDGGTLSAAVATISKQRYLGTTLLYTQQLSANKTFGDHHIAATAVFETQNGKSTQESASGQQDNNLVKSLTGATNINAGSSNQEVFIMSYVGRVTYDFANKYLLSASIRKDGLSIWAPEKKYGTFPSVSVGWRLDQENFMKNVKQVSELKLRGGYGLTGLDGNGSLGAYPWQTGISQNNSTYSFAGSPVPGVGAGSYYNSLGNKDLNWEITKQLNIGMDLGLFRNKFTLVAEYFQRQTDNLILLVPTPGSFGFEGGGTLTNIGSIQNKGFEFQAAYNKTTGVFKWNVTGLVSIIKNKVLKLNSPNAAIVTANDPDISGGADITRTVAGQPVQQFYGFVTDGIFQTAAQVASSAVQGGGAGVGDIKFKDLNGDKKIDENDRTFLGSYLPKFSYSLNLSASYKSFDATIFFQGNQGNKIFNGGRVLSEGMRRLFNASTAVLNAWTPANTNTSIPRAINGDPNSNARVSNRWIEDGSYLRLKNLNFGYSINAEKLQSLTKGAVSRLRIYVSSQNLLTFTKYKGWDPEIGSRNGTLTNGIDYGQYPSARSYQVGVQVGF